MIKTLTEKLFKKQRKSITKIPSNLFNKKLIDSAMYQFLVRYLEVDYGFNTAVNWTYDKMEKCEFLFMGENEMHHYSYQLNYAAFPVEDLNLAQYQDIMFNMLMAITDRLPDNPLVTTNPEVEYGIMVWIRRRTDNICRVLYEFYTTHKSINLVENLSQNIQLHRLIKSHKRMWKDLDSRVIFHTCNALMDENKNNVVDIALNHPDIVYDVEYAVMVYTGNHFDPFERTSPLIPSMEYIEARSKYARHEIGEKVGFEDIHEDEYIGRMLYKAKARHAEMAHQFCIDYVHNREN